MAATTHTGRFRRGAAMDGDAADLLIPLCLVLWSATSTCGPDTPATELGIRVTSGHNAGDTRLTAGTGGVAYEPGAIDGLPTVLEFDPASFVLTAYGRINGGTARGDQAAADRFLTCSSASRRTRLTEIFENRDYKGSNHFFFDLGHGSSAWFGEKSPILVSEGT